jgi:hypothetical protein
MLKSLLLASALTLAFSGTAMAKPEGKQIIVANNPSVGSTKIGTLYLHSGGAGWLTGPTLNANAPSTQKTLGASNARSSIMYRKADGNTYIVDGSISFVSNIAGWVANFDESQEQPIFTDTNFASQFKLTPEEIEIDPVSNDIFALVSGPTAFAPKQIYRIKRDPDGNAYHIATAMTMNTSVNGNTPNGNRAFINPAGNGYKSGSLAIVPNPSGGHRLIFTHESTVYQGICHWVYDIQTGVNENKLKAALHPSNVPMSKCQKTTPLNGTGTSPSPPGAGIAAGTGINTVYIGPQTAPATGVITPGRLLMSRNGGPMYEVGGLLIPGQWTTVPITPASPNHTLSNDFAWIRNEWVQEQ